MESILHRVNLIKLNFLKTEMPTREKLQYFATNLLVLINIFPWTLYYNGDRNHKAYDMMV